MQDNDRVSGRRSGRLSGAGVVRSRTNGKACCTCHRRKVRCDILTHGTPCSNCEAQGEAECRMYIRQSSRRSAVSRRASASHSNSSRGPTVTPATRSPHSTPATAETTTSARSDPLAPSTNEPTPASSKNGPTASRGRDRNVSTQEDEPEASHLSEFLSQEARGVEISYTTRLYFIGTEFSTLHHLVRQRSQPSELNTLHFGSRPHAPPRPQVPSDCLRLPGKKLIRELVDAFFSHINSGFPIVHQEAFMASYNSHDRNNPMSLLLLNAILFGGAHALSLTKPEIGKLAPQFYGRAKQLFDARYDPDREKYIQAALIFTFHCDRLEDVVSNSWYWVGVATRSAYGIGLQREASNSRILDSIKLHWIRSWWTLYQFDVMTSAAHGRPQSIDLDQSDVAPLDESHFEGVESSSDFAIHHTRVCLILGRAMRKMTDLRATADDRLAATKQADKELAEFLVDLPRSLQAFSYEAADSWLCILHLSYYYCLLLLHRPSPVQGEREMTNEDTRICSDSVAAITAIFDSLRKRQMLGNLWIPSAYVLFATLVHVSTQLQSSNPIVAASSRRLYSQLMDTLQAMTAKWLFARSLLMVFQRGLSQNLGLHHGKPLSIEGSEENPSEVPPWTGPWPFSDSHVATGNGSRQPWAQDQDQDMHMMPPTMNTSLEEGNAGYFGPAYLPSDSMTSMQLDFELFLAGIGTGYDGAPDFTTQV